MTVAADRARMACAGRLNRGFDMLPRQVIHLGAREVPAFRAVGVVGAHLAVPVAILAGVRAGVSVLDVLGTTATAAVSFVVLALVRRAVTGRESLVLLEHAWLSGAAVAGYLWLARGPILPGVDVFATALCVFLAAGRIGCLTVGCCHGQPAPVGIRYRAGAAVPERLRGVRLFPVALVEAVALGAIAASGFVLCGRAPGTATVWVLASYAVVRLGTEALRGDRRSGTVARVMALGQLAGAVVASELWLVPGGPGRRQLVAGVVLGVVLVVCGVLAWRRRDPLGRPAHLDEVWSTLTSLARSAPAGGTPETATTSAEVHVAASWEPAGLHVSLSHPSRRVDGVPYGLGLEPLTRTATATHVVVPDTRVGPRPAADRGALGAPEPGYFERRGGTRPVRR